MLRDAKGTTKFQWNNAPLVKKSIWCIWVSRYLVTPFIGAFGVPRVYCWWLNSSQTSNLTSVNLSMLFFRGFHSNSCGGPGFWPSGTRTLHDFSHIFLSKLCVFGCTWPNCTHYQLQGVVAPWTWDTTCGFFSQSLRNPIKIHSLTTISWIQNWLKSVVLLWIHPCGSLWHILMMYQKDDIIYWNIMICIISEAFIDTAKCFTKKAQPNVALSLEAVSSHAKF